VPLGAHDVEPARGEDLLPLGLALLLEPDEDRAHIFQLDPRMKSEGLGLATLPVTDVFMIV